MATTTASRPLRTRSTSPSTSLVNPATTAYSEDRLLGCASNSNPFASHALRILPFPSTSTYPPARISVPRFKRYAAEAACALTPTVLAPSAPFRCVCTLPHVLLLLCSLRLASPALFHSPPLCAFSWLVVPRLRPSPRRGNAPHS
ncbi:hypothetical protein DFH09DRAFT_1331940 [Mycena vulgaris]|nr:hypothetical protein DFH09DRAFT_1331940 [Mycena vulgaris]